MIKQKNILLKIGGYFLLTSALTLDYGESSEQDDQRSLHIKSQVIEKGNFVNVTAGRDIIQTFNENNHHQNHYYGLPSPK